jgi:hypothetical protein
LRHRVLDPTLGDIELAASITVAMATRLATTVVAPTELCLDLAFERFFDDCARSSRGCRRRTTNLLERLFGEERRRTKVIPHAFGERAVLKLMYAALLRASQTWQRVAITEFERRQIDDLRADLDEEFKRQSVSTKTTASRHRIYSKSET